MDAPLEEIAFLARSENRVAILLALDDRSLTKQDLQAETGVSRSTLGRALGDLEERSWIERNGRTYETTTAGDLVLDRFVPLLETMGGIRTLDDAVDLLPVSEMVLDVRHLADARVVTPTELDPTAPYEYHTETFQEIDSIGAVARTAPPAIVEAIHEEVVSRQIDATVVLDSTYLDALSADDEMRTWWREMATGSATVLRHEGPIPYVLTRLDEMVHLWPCDDDGDTWGLLETDEPAVLGWAEDTISSYLAEAEPAQQSLAV